MAPKEGVGFKNCKDLLYDPIGNEKAFRYPTSSGNRNAHRKFMRSLRKELSSRHRKTKKKAVSKIPINASKVGFFPLLKTDLNAGNLYGGVITVSMAKRKYRRATDQFFACKNIGISPFEFIRGNIIEKVLKFP